MKAIKILDQVDVRIRLRVAVKRMRADVRKIATTSAYVTPENRAGFPKNASHSIKERAIKRLDGSFFPLNRILSYEKIFVCCRPFIVVRPCDSPTEL